MKKVIVSFLLGAFVATSGVAMAAQSIQILVNGTPIKSDVPAQIVGGRTMVPLRAVGEALGADVQWDNATRSVIIKAPWLPSKPQNNTGEKNQVKGGNILVTVSKIERSQGSEYDKPKEGTEFVILHLTLKNTGSTKQSYNSYDFGLQNSNGNITNTAFTIINNDTALHYGELAGGGTVSGSLAFEIPQGDNNLKLIYKYEFNKEVSVNLVD